jgi:glycosyltransferase involved in cell wall biosynthesis
MVLPHPTGIGRATVNLIDNLARVGPEHEFVAMSLTGEIPGLSSLPNVTHIKAPYGHLSPAMHYGMPRLIRRSRCDLAHYLYFVTPLYSPVPAVVTLFDTTYSRFPELLPPHHRLLYRFCMRRCVRRAKRIVCSTRAAVEDLRGFFPETDSSKIRVIPLGVDERFRPQDVADPDAAKAELGLPDKYVLYLGNHRGHKNLRRLIQAFDYIATRTPHSLVLPRPSGPGAEITLSAVERAEARERIVFHPMPDEHLPLIYSLADVFVFPSLSEGFGLPPLEAMACGTPVVASNISSIPEVVGDAGILADPYDAEGIAKLTIRALMDSGLRRDLRARGLEQAQRFSWKETARLTLNLYEDVYS